MEKLSYNRYVETFWTLEKYSKEYAYQLEKLLQITNKHMKNGFSILDIGAGTGLFAKSFLKNTKIQPSSYTAIEPSDAHVKLIEENLKSFSLSKNIIHQKFTPKTKLDGKFDLIVMSHCIYWLTPNPKQHLLNILALLKPAGKIVIFLGTHTNFVYLMNCCFRDKLPADRMPDHRFSSFELTEILNKIRISYKLSYLPGTLEVTNILNSKDKTELWNLIAFSLLVEPSSIDKNLLDQAENFIRLSSYKKNNELMLNLNVGVVEIS